jgi:hypothetical protein
MHMPHSTLQLLLRLELNGKCISLNSTRNGTRKESNTCTGRQSLALLLWERVLLCAAPLWDLVGIVCCVLVAKVHQWKEAQRPRHECCPEAPHLYSLCLTFLEPVRHGPLP